LKGGSNLKTNSIKAIILILIIITVFSCTTQKNVSMETINLNDIEMKLDNFFLTESQEERIAILPIKSDFLSSDESEALRLYLEEKVLNNGNYILIENSEINNILKSQQQFLSGSYNEKDAIEIGKLLFANHMVLIQTGEIKNTAYLNLKIIDVEKGTIVKAENIYTKSKDDLLYLISPTLRNLNADKQKQNENKSKLTIKSISINSVDPTINIPIRTIKIDGKIEDWAGIEPIKLSSIDDNKFYSQYFLARDENGIYIRIDPVTEDVFLMKKKHFYITIAPIKNDFPGSINMGGTITDEGWKVYLAQNTGTHETGDIWNFFDLNYDFGKIGDTMELRVNYDWLQNLDFFYAKVGLHDDTTEKGLYMSFPNRFSLEN